MDKNILYLFRLFTVSDYLLKSKYFSQIKSFKSFFQSVYFFEIKNKILNLYKDDLIIKIIKVPIFFRLFPFLLYFYLYYQVLFLLKKGIINIEVIYFRNYFISIGLSRLLNYCKVSKISIYIELPTYPIKNEILTYGNFLKILYLVVNNLFIKYVSTFTKYFILISSDLTHIHNARVISIDNCIDCSNNNLNSRILAKNPINLTFIANFSRWHGLERLLMSLSKYDSLNTNKFHIYLICPKRNKEVERLYKKFKHLFTSNYVSIEDSSNKNNILKITSMGISSLALYKIKIMRASVLKSREYACQGLPILYGYQDNLLDKFPQLFKKVPNDNSLIDFDDLHRFIENFNLNFNLNINNIFDISKNQMNWKAEYEKVFIFK